MKIITVNGKRTLRISRSEWKSIGKLSNWDNLLSDPLYPKNWDNILSHPLYQKVDSPFGKIPEQNYYRAVWSKLVDIIAEKKKVSEKSFSERDKIHDCVNHFLREPETMAVVTSCKRNNKRPQYCSEKLFDKFADKLLNPCKTSSTNLKIKTAGVMDIKEHNSLVFWALRKFDQDEKKSSGVCE